MVYKSKKINKRRYIKRQTRKLMKEVGMYGGDGQPSLSINNQQGISEIPKEEVPTLGDNVEAVGNLATSLVANATADGIQKVAEYTGLNPNDTISENVEKASDKIEDIVEVLNSPEGEKLKEETGQLLAEGIEVLKPSLEKGQEILMDGAKKLTETGTGIVITAANELPPIFLMNELSKFGTAGVQAGKMFIELATTGAEAGKSLQEQKKKAESLWGRATNLFGNISQGINSGVSGTIKYAQEGVDKYGQNVVEQGKRNFSDINSGVSGVIKSAQEGVDKYGQNVVEQGKKNFSNINMSSSVQAEGGSLKKYQKEKMMIGGRISQSQSEFLRPQVNSLQISQQYGGKWQTKRRRYLKRKMTSRSYK